MFGSCCRHAGAISISITFFNKAVLSVYKFNFGNTLMLAQMIASLFFMHFMKKYGLIKYKDFDPKVAKQVCLLLAFWGVHSFGFCYHL